ncbi:transglycosylase domain-containing protein [Blastococcus sp. CT_GayMR19]|uniref:transglycosylase domain-containing protein n=1 Tax=Blastococcus sp. CT_GayMR19 TaxID=2559608 RepID=UPI001FD76B8D|nr:transglycosylase domain-containing protein [Blastococcus sp. CT_GayMR19]
MPSHDETSPVAPRAGSVRRPPPARTRSTGGGGGRARTTASRTAAGRPAAGRPAGSRANGGKGTGSRSAKPRGKAPRSKKQVRNRRLKILGALMAGMLVLLGVFVGVVYASTEVPSPDSITTAQTTVVYYSDGTSEMARLGDENRTNVALDQIAKPAQEAVLAAENREFYTDPGISFTGIVRAAWNNVTGGSTQGGSTITQQYVKNAILQNSDQTFGRKFQELFLAIKLDNNYSKDQILENYLNTIYYGRGAYGIESAANTYFKVPASQLTAQQGAVLAVLIRSPSRYDPEVSPEDAQDRWGKVLDAMVEEGWLTQEERTASVYPPVEPKAAGSLGIPAGPEGLIVQKAIEELEGKHGYDEQQIRAGGLRIVTTVDKGYQDAAVAARNEVMQGEPEPLKEALVAVDPRSGAVRAYYGGESGTGNDYADAQRQPGSSIKPYVLGAALEQGISVTARRDGSSPQTFQDREAPVRNSGGVSCPACTLKEAITRSLNTTFYGLAFEVGPPNVAEFTRRATGLPDVWEGGGLKGKTTLANPNSGNVGSSIGIGEYEMRPIDQAVGFATFASGGTQRDPYFVAKVNDSAGTLLLETVPDPGEQVMTADVANDVTYGIKDVADYSKRPLEDGREVASKTGTVGSSDTDNSDAWMVGYTPSLSTAVWMGNDTPSDPIVDVRGRIIYGSGLPGAIWQRFMSTVLAGTPEEDLPDKASFQGDSGEGVPEPTTAAPPPTSAAPAPTTETTAPTEDTSTETSVSAPTTPTTPTTGSPAQGSPGPATAGGGGAGGGGGGGGAGGQPRP